MVLDQLPRATDRIFDRIAVSRQRDVGASSIVRSSDSM